MSWVLGLMFILVVVVLMFMGSNKKLKRLNGVK